MERGAGLYALVQFSAVPERQEFVNVGIILLVPDANFFEVRMADDFSRLDKVFGYQPRTYIAPLMQSMRNRLKHEWVSSHSIERLSEFARKRANDLRLSQLLPVAVDDPAETLDRLFDKLVDGRPKKKREPRMQRKLREAFEKSGVTRYLDRPEEIVLPEYGIKVQVPYGYQNGCYNLIDGMNMREDQSEGLREAGKRAIEGNLLWKHFDKQRNPKRLVVIGDFAKQTEAFYRGVAEQMQAAHVKLYRLDDLNPLFRDIEQNSRLHGLDS